MLIYGSSHSLLPYHNYYSCVACTLGTCCIHMSMSRPPAHVSVHPSTRPSVHRPVRLVRLFCSVGPSVLSASARSASVRPSVCPSVVLTSTDVTRRSKSEMYRCCCSHVFSRCKRATSHMRLYTNTDASTCLYRMNMEITCSLSRSLALSFSFFTSFFSFFISLSLSLLLCFS